jgi:acetyl-CoA acetyltransferase
VAPLKSSATSSPNEYWACRSAKSPNIKGPLAIQYPDGSIRLGPGGDFPLNTAGGQLAEGRLHGISFLNEAVLQLRGQCADRQVSDAQVAVVTSGVYPQCGAMVLTGA